MSDAFYRFVRVIGTPCFAVSARATVLGKQHIPRHGAFILAATHQSPFDVPLLIRHTPRLLDFVSITEVFRNPFVAWFYGSMNAFPLDRSRPDAATVRRILGRLDSGRAVAMFPEGRIRSGQNSVLYTRQMRRGLGRLAEMTDTPVVPCVIHNSQAYSCVMNWAPLRRVRYGIIYGQPLSASGDAATLERRYIDALISLNETLLQQMARNGSIAEQLADDSPHAVPWPIHEPDERCKRPDQHD